MNNKKPKCIVISASSDIGLAICKHWVAKGWQVYGTYRTKSKSLKELGDLGVSLVHCDLKNKKSIKDACENMRKLCKKWDILFICSGTLEPIGPFLTSDFDKWEDAITINLTSQLRIVHELAVNRNINNKLEPCVLLFSGGGVNSATLNYSAYTVSKIALIKMSELLDAEIPDTRFFIAGPGWVKTKIHEETLSAGELAGGNYKITKSKLSSNECTSLDKILSCCDWLVNSSKQIAGGRNFSVVHDCWGSQDLSQELLKNTDMYKLRRLNNDWRVRSHNKN